MSAVSGSISPERCEPVNLETVFIHCPELEADGQIGTDKANALSADAQAILDAVQGPGKTSPTALRPAAEESTWSGMKSLYR